MLADKSQHETGLNLQELRWGCPRGETSNSKAQHAERKLDSELEQDRPAMLHFEQLWNGKACRRRNQQLWKGKACRRRNHRMAPMAREQNSVCTQQTDWKGHTMPMRNVIRWDGYAASIAIWAQHPAVSLRKCCHSSRSSTLGSCQANGEC